MPDRLTSARHEVDADRVGEFFIERGWSDGLPVVAPTPERVAGFLDAAGVDGAEVLGEIPEQAATLTAELVAVNAVLAGCRPEYASVVFAAVRAISTERFNLHSTSVSGATAPLVIVSGSAVERFGLNSGFSVFGPGHVANATIGRAVRLVLQNLCGATPGVGDKATFGHPGKYSFCIAENNARNPWGPVHTDFGLPADASAVTMFSGEAPVFARNDWSSEPEPILATIADAMLPTHYTGGRFVVVLGPLHAEILARSGMTKSQVTDALAGLARRSVADLKRAGRMPGPSQPGDEEDIRQVVGSGADIVLVVAGGHLYGYSAVVPPWVGGHESLPVTVALTEQEQASCEISPDETPAR